MRRYIRAAVPGGTFFFTVTLQDRSAGWLVTHADVLRECMGHVKAAHPFRVDAMVVLPEHLHAIWTLPTDDADFPLRWMLIKRRFTRELLYRGLLDAAASRRRGDAERALWQRRYREHQIRDEDDLRRHVDYIHFNPLKHGLAPRAADWPHSSFHRYVRAGRLPADWGLSAQLGGRSANERGRLRRLGSRSDPSDLQGTKLGFAARNPAYEAPARGRAVQPS